MMKQFTAKLVQPPANNWGGGEVRFNFEARDEVDADAFTQALTMTMNMNRQHYMPQWQGTSEQIGE